VYCAVGVCIDEISKHSAHEPGRMDVWIQRVCSEAEQLLAQSDQGSVEMCFLAVCLLFAYAFVIKFLLSLCSYNAPALRVAARLFPLHIMHRGNAATHV
jgi:hypothetical protein